MKVFVINLDRSEDRWAHYENTDYIRWSATDGSKIDRKDDILTRMTYTHNIKEHNHRGKCGCFLSHISLWKYIIDNKINDVLILEDDAEKVMQIPKELPQDSLTYLGGLLFEKKITDGEYKGPHTFDKINDIIDFKVLMTMSYYIPRYELLIPLHDFILSQKRYRAIDIMLNNERLPIKRKFVYPAVFKERKCKSTIDSGSSFHQKTSSIYYRWC